MSVLDYIVTKLKTGLLTFVNMVTNANIDLPYYDDHVVTAQLTSNSYNVGQNQVDLNGTQKKFFVSKNTLIYSTEDQVLHFNSINNVVVPILANTWYTFYHNIYRVYFTTPTGENYLLMYFEGTLPPEARNPE